MLQITDHTLLSKRRGRTGYRASSESQAITGTR